MPAIKTPSASVAATTTASPTSGANVGAFSPFSNIVGLAAIFIGLFTVLIIALIATYIIRRAERSRRARMLAPPRRPCIVFEKDIVEKISIWVQVKTYFKELNLPFKRNQPQDDIEAQTPVDVTPKKTLLHCCLTWLKGSDIIASSNSSTSTLWCPSEVSTLTEGDDEPKYLPFPEGYEEPIPYMGPAFFEEESNGGPSGPTISVQEPKYTVSPYDANFANYIRGPHCPWLFDMWTMDRLQVPMMQFQAPVHYAVGSDSQQHALYLSSVDCLARAKKYRAEVGEKNFPSRLFH
ncbi:hypothetical protein QCA50_004414 [Cerrena zonata]|uniref:Uncharacterized protein n=1 Tax=Cerrena zonata TaxID=2478898 RepID=A0AAW0GHG0_9APHY